MDTSKGAGVADVLFRNRDGAVNYDFRGKLSFSWPVSTNQLVLNVGDDNYEPLFPFGYGLTYTDDVELSNRLPTGIGDERFGKTTQFKGTSCVD
jgi:beta-glucosidase